MKELISRFKGRKILIYGDFVLDEFLFGQIDRISREAPVFIVSHENSDFRPGCAANTAANLAAMGAQVLPLGVIGDDEKGRDLINVLAGHGVDAKHLTTDPNCTTAVKTRVIAGGLHSIKQQIVRIDKLNESQASDDTDAEISEKFAQLLPEADAVLISDYGIGGLKLDLALQLLQMARQQNKPVMVDSRYRLMEYKGATAMTPNQPEVEGCLNTTILTEEQLHKSGAELKSKLDVQALVVTRGGEGMTVFEDGKSPADIPAFGEEEVVDVTGAGDTVISAFSLAIAAGADFVAAAKLANVAGGLSVVKKGTCTVSSDEILAALESNPL
jgi:rfaE bifunctional protein kinase chain/domain